MIEQSNVQKLIENREIAYDQAKPLGLASSYSSFKKAKSSWALFRYHSQGLTFKKTSAAFKNGTLTEVLLAQMMGLFETTVNIKERDSVKVKIYPFPSPANQKSNGEPKQGYTILETYMKNTFDLLDPEEGRFENIKSICLDEQYTFRSGKAPSTFDKNVQKLVDIYPEWLQVYKDMLKEKQEEEANRKHLESLKKENKLFEVTQIEYDKAYAQAKSMYENKDFIDKFLFHDKDMAQIDYQFTWIFPFQGDEDHQDMKYPIWVKCPMDFVKWDFQNKRVVIVDTKTTSDTIKKINPVSKWSQIYKLEYPVQAAMYRMAIQNYLEEHQMFGWDIECYLLFSSNFGLSDVNYSSDDYNAEKLLVESQFFILDNLYLDELSFEIKSLWAEQCQRAVNDNWLETHELELVTNPEL